MSKLFIVESPNKCSKIKSFLGADYNVMASVGHIRQMPKKGLNIDIKNGFTPTYEIIHGKGEVVKRIKEAAKKSDEIFLATDPDREGEAISQHIYDVLDKESQKKCKRITFSEITSKAILAALRATRNIDDKLVDAQRARQVLDRLIGYKVSPTLWYTGHMAGTSAGRVQSIALKLICEREKEIQAFKPEDYWFVEALLKADKGEFWAKVITKNKDNKYLDEKIAQEDLEKLRKASFKVAKVTKKTENHNAYPPFDTSSLQTACSSIYGFSAAKTSAVAQKLYEQGIVTYIRTDSYNISEDAMTEVRDLIKKSGGDVYLPTKPNVYSKKSGAAAQEAHECIRPTHLNDKGESLEPDEQKMYKLIRDRFIACQMTPMVIDIVEYNIKASTGHELIARGQTIKFDGWYKVYKYAKTKEEELPEVKEGENLDLKDIKCEKHTTKPPPRYKDGSLVKKMEADGVGRPSTRAMIIKTIQDREYVIKEKGGAFKATILGMKVCDFLTPHFKDFFMDIKYTSKVEDDLDEIAKGEKKFLDVIQTFYEFLLKHIKDVQGTSAPMEAVTTGQKCTVCKEGEIVEKDGKYGKFFSCSKYPDCKTVFVKSEDGTFSVKSPSKSKKTGKECPECKKHDRKGELIERTNRNNGNKFIACSCWPKCKYCESLDGTKDYKAHKESAKGKTKEDDDVNLSIDEEENNE
jgi:DNA topoisomerase I